MTDDAFDDGIPPGTESFYQDAVFRADRHLAKVIESIVKTSDEVAMAVLKREWPRVLVQENKFRP